MGGAEGWVIIANPIAGNGYGAECAEIARAMMKSHGVPGDVVLTQAKGHATTLAEGFVKKGVRHIVGLGGDGTLSEVARALVGSHESVFGAVAAGTGNDFIHMLGFPDRFAEDDWQALFQARVARMDVGRCNGMYFFNGMGLGFDAAVALANYHMENGGEVRKGTKSKYLWHIIKSILLYKERDMTLTMDGRTEPRKCFLNSISNGRRMAGGFYITPKAEVDDGLLDVCMADPLRIPGRLKELVSVMKQTHLDDKPIHYHQVPGLAIQFDSPAPAHLDGEVFFSTRFDVDVLPGALSVIINQGGEHYFRRPSP
jgi:diacylglycerol kinase (ATP)